jgi:hypothetical protein
MIFSPCGTKTLIFSLFLEIGSNFLLSDIRTWGFRPNSTLEHSNIHDASVSKALDYTSTLAQEKHAALQIPAVWNLVYNPV